jgi:hypothetical protein
MVEAIERLRGEMRSGWKREVRRSTPDSSQRYLIPERKLGGIRLSASIKTSVAARDFLAPRLRCVQTWRISELIILSEGSLAASLVALATVLSSE